ncbi:MAG: caspase family protein, partial [Phormidesmis sp.]
MTQCLYALLVGINEYDRRSRVSALRGCTNDAKAMKTYLETQVDSSKTQLNIQILLDEQATRQAIIDGFRAHLQQARAGDTVLFYYAGHGSQGRAPEEFWRFNPSRLNETLVCYDSRVEGSWDLADKELAKLIAEVSEYSPHITVVLDCCHSGSGTRAAQATGELVFATRQAPIDERDRPLESFIVTKSEVESEAELTRPSTRSLDDSSAGWTMPQGRHVLIAACRDTEEASEYSAQGQPCGAFSHFLLDTLYKAKEKLTYRDLFKATYAKTRANVTAQSPQIEAPYLEDFDQPFLGGLAESSPAYFTLSYSVDLGWHISGGAIHGIQPPLNNEATRLALFSLDSSPADLQQLRGAIAQANVTDVQPQISRIETPAALDRKATYKAVVTYLPIP